MSVTITLTKREAQIVLDALNFLSAYTSVEMGEHLGWKTADQQAWNDASGKLSKAVGAGAVAS